MHADECSASLFCVCDLEVFYCRQQFLVKGQMVNILDFAGHHGLCHLFFVFACFPDPLKMYKTFLALGLYKNKTQFANPCSTI